MDFVDAIHLSKSRDSESFITFDKKLVKSASKIATILYPGRRCCDFLAGGKWRLSYQSYTGQSGNLEVDLNFMFRQPLWDIHLADHHVLGDFQAKNIPLPDMHDGGLISALLHKNDDSVQ